MKRLIFEDTKKQNDLLRYGISKIISLANNVRDDYNKLGFGDLDNDTYKGILSGGYSYVENRILSDVNDALAKANMTLPSIKKMAVEDAYRTLNNSNIGRSIDNLTSGLPYTPSVYTPVIHLTGGILNLQDGKFSLIDIAKEELFEEHTRIYIESDEDQVIWDSLNSLATSLNAQNDLLRKMGANLIQPSPGGTHIHPDTLFFLFDTKDNGEFTVKPTALKYLRGFAESKAHKDMTEKRRRDREDRETAAKEQREKQYYNGKTVKEWAMSDMRAESPLIA